MSLVNESPVNSSSSDDFAAFLDAELDSTSDTIPQQEEEEKEEESDDDPDNEDDHKDHETSLLIERAKRRKIIVLDGAEEPNGSTFVVEQTEVLEASVKEDVCAHPGFIGGMCIKCGVKVDDNQSGVAFGYIHKDLRLANDEVARLRDRDLKRLLRQKKLYLVLDLDHTLLNSTSRSDIIQDEEYLLNENDPTNDALKGSLYKLPFMNMVTKLRPYVHTFLEKAKEDFEMYIYTMGERAYAIEMAKLLDPSGIYFNSRVIAKVDCTQRHQKGLDVVLGQENAVLILDDTEQVWGKHKDNLISMERYHFFASSCKQFGYKSKSLSELRSDESDVDGALATVLNVLKRVHTMFFDGFDPEQPMENLAGRDARLMLRAVRSEVLKGCKIVFSRVFPTKFQAENHHLWMLAERLGATCSTEVDSSVTHIISTDTGTEKSRWAVKENKFLVDPRWLEAAYFLWRREPEEGYLVKDVKVNR